MTKSGTPSNTGDFVDSIGPGKHKGDEFVAKEDCLLRGEELEVTTKLVVVLSAVLAAMVYPLAAGADVFEFDDLNGTLSVLDNGVPITGNGGRISRFTQDNQFLSFAISPSTTFSTLPLFTTLLSPITNTPIARFVILGGPGINGIEFGVGSQMPPTSLGNVVPGIPLMPDVVVNGSRQFVGSIPAFPGNPDPQNFIPPTPEDRFYAAISPSLAPTIPLTPVPTPTPTPTPPTKTSAQRQAANDAFNRLAGLGLTIGTIGKRTICDGICEAAGGALGLAAGLVKLLDPTDPNFTQIATPTPPLISPPSTSTPTFNDLFAAVSEALGFEQASQTSFNRASGAFAANDAASEALQLDAAVNYFNQALADFQRIYGDILSLDLPDTFLTAEDIANFLNSPLSPEELALAAQLGLDPATLFAGIDPNALVGSSAQHLAELAQQQVGEPSSLAMLGSGLLLFLGFGSQFRKTASRPGRSLPASGLKVKFGRLRRS